MHGKIQAAFPGGGGKVSSHSTAATQLVFLSPVCSVFRVSKPQSVRLFTTDGYGIFNVRTNLGACRTHEVGSDTNKSAQELTRRDRSAVPGKNFVCFIA